MSPSARCDEILRMIDEVLDDATIPLGAGVDLDQLSTEQATTSPS